MARTNEFRLGSVLAWRIRERDTCRQRLADIRRTEDELRRQLERLLDEMQTLRDGQRDALRQGTVQLANMLAHQRYEQTLRNDVHCLRVRGRELAEEFDRRQQELLEADRNVQILEKLRDQHGQEAAAEDARREQARLDETATHRHHRRAAA